MCYPRILANGWKVELCTHCIHMFQNPCYKLLLQSWLVVKTSGFKRKLCSIKSTIVPSYNSIMGAIFEYDINQA